LATAHGFMKTGTNFFLLQKCILSDFLRFFPFAQYLFEVNQRIESIVCFFIAWKFHKVIMSLITHVDCSLVMNKFTDATFFFLKCCVGLASIYSSQIETETIVLSEMMHTRVNYAFGSQDKSMNFPFAIKVRYPTLPSSITIVAYLDSIWLGKYKRHYFHQISQ
jgi:hypothetical protein